MLTAAALSNSHAHIPSALREQAHSILLRQVKNLLLKFVTTIYYGAKLKIRQIQVIKWGK